MLPIVKFLRKTVFRVAVTWGADNCNCGCGSERLLRWKFYLNGHLVLTTPWSALDAVLPIGNGGTYSMLLATDAEIIDFLVDNGTDVEVGDRIRIVVEAQDCLGNTSDSNPIDIVVDDVPENCACEFVTEYDNEQIGDTATTDVDGGLMVFRNGHLNYNGLDFSEDEMVEGDELFVVGISDCDAGLAFSDMIEGETTTVPIPDGFESLPASQMLLWRNGLLQFGFSKSGSDIVPSGEPSDNGDQWLFARLASDNGCEFHSFLVSASATGSTIQLPIGYTAANQQDWILVRGGLAMTPAVHYSVNGSGLATLDVAASAELFWIVTIN